MRAYNGFFKSNMFLRASVCLVLFLLAGAHADAKSSESIKLEKVSNSDFMKSFLGKNQSVQAFVTGLPAIETGNENEAPRLYLSPDQHYAIVEVCLSSKRTASGLYVINPTGQVDSYGWYDASFSEFLCKEGCSKSQDCYYKIPEIEADGPIRHLTYDYQINLQSGSYKLELMPAHKIRILGKHSEEQT